MADGDQRGGVQVRENLNKNLRRQPEKKKKKLLDVKVMFKWTQTKFYISGELFHKTDI